MSDAIALLERLACEPYSPADDITLSASLEPPLQAAVQARDPRALAAALGRADELACLVATPDQDAPRREEGPLDDQPEPADIPGESDV